MRSGSAWFPRILAASFLVQTAVYGLRPMVSYQALAVGAGPVELGVITSAFALLSLVLAVPIGRWVDRWGEPRFVVLGTALISLVALGLVWIDSIPALALSQAALGLGHILNVVATQTLIANGGDPAGRDGRFGAFTVAVSLGQLAGPALAGLVAGEALRAAAAPAAGTDPVFVLAAGSAALACLVGVTLWRWPPPRVEARAAAASSSPPQGSRATVRRVLTVPSMPEAMLASLTVLTSIDILVAYLPAYGQANGIPVEVVGLLLATRAGASLVSRLLIMPLTRMLGRRRLLAASMLMPAGALLFVPLLTSLPLLFVLMLFIGFGLGLGQPLTLSWVASRAPLEVRGTAIGVRLSGNRLGQLVLPAAVGVMAGWGGLAAIFWALTALLGVAATLVFRAEFGDRASAEPDTPMPPQ